MSDNKFMQAAKLWAATAWADNVLSDEEKLGMAVIIKVADLTDEERATAMSWLEEPVDLEDLDLSNVEDKHAVYSSAARITTIDNEVADREIWFLGRLREALGIDEETAKKLHQDIPWLAG
jgi:uncharacterized membrane protein YebE (DUF533 family)